MRQRREEALPQALHSSSYHPALLPRGEDRRARRMEEGGKDGAKEDEEREREGERKRVQERDEKEAGGRSEMGGEETGRIDV